MSRRLSAAKWRRVSLLASFTAILAAFSGAAFSQTLPTAQSVGAQIKLGWNLGNTMEAQCGENAWGNPMVTQSFINSVKAAGFNAIRIPAAWNCHTNPAGSTTIDAAWMARVKQVVDYAYNQGMYVILNIHWDGGWLEEHPLYANQTANNQRQAAFWTQIGTTFRDYNERMIFAGTNEVHADYGTPTTEHLTVQQSYNQTFVNAVRATGGNNASRTLAVQTYNTNIQHGLNFFTLPTDTIANRLMVEVHYYDPYDYTLNSGGSCFYWGAPYPPQSACSWAQESYVDTLFAQVKTKWVDAGIPVFIGEWAVGVRPNLNLESRQYYYEYINRAAALNGIKTFYWDIGVPPTQPGGDALLDRNSGAIVDQGALDAIKRGAGITSGTTYTLTTSVSGSGTVTRAPNATSYASGTSVTLTATPASGFVFAGWSGGASGSSNPLTIVISNNTTVTASFTAQTGGGTGTILREYWLNVSGTAVSALTSNANYPGSPTGSGQLTSFEGPTDTADNYGSRVRGYVHPPTTGAYTFWIASDDNSELYLSTSDNPANATRIALVESWTSPRQWTKFAAQQSVAVTLTAGQKYYIEARQKEGGGGDNLAVAWQGPGITQSVIAGTYLSPFVAQTGTFALSVAKAGSGSGTVTSSTGGVNCGATCSASYSSGTSVTLTAAAASGSTFAGWSGACSGTAACTVSMTQARSVTATFNSATATFALSVTKSGTGTGTVTSTPSGVSCGGTCTANYASGTSVTLAAAPASGSTFAGWGGACSGTGSCTVSMTAARAVTATFNTSGGTGTTCSNPITFTGSTGNFNTNGAVCFRTTANVNGWGCSSFDGRTVTVGGEARTCGQLPLTRSSDGYFYFLATAGTYPWATIFTW